MSTSPADTVPVPAASGVAAQALTAGAATIDRIRSVKLASITLPLATPISDAKVFTGRQKPMTEVALLFAEVRTEDDHEGIGFSYSKRAGGPGQFAHAQEIAPALIGEDPSDIGKIWTKLVWAGASVGRSGLSTQSIAAFDVALWDLKAKRASLPLAKLLGAYRDSVRTYNTSGGFLHAPIDQVMENSTHALSSGIGGIKIKVGQPDWKTDIARLERVREHLGDDVPLMVDANQQWDRATAQRMGRLLERFNLVWIEEPLDAYDADGHAQLTRSLDTPIATGEMLASVAEHVRLIDPQATDIIQPDAPAHRRHHSVPQTRRAGRGQAPGTGTALRDGNSRPSGCRLPDRAVGGALRLARPAVQRAPGNQGRPDARVRPARAGIHPQRPS